MSGSPFLLAAPAEGQDLGNEFACAVARFGHSVDLLPVGTIASVFEEVERGHADYGF